MPLSQQQDDTNKVESSVGETKQLGVDCRHLSLEVSKLPPGTGPSGVTRQPWNFLLGYVKSSHVVEDRKITELALGSARQLVKGVPSCRKFCGALIRQWNAALLQLPLFFFFNNLRTLTTCHTAESFVTISMEYQPKHKELMLNMKN